MVLLRFLLPALLAGHAVRDRYSLLLRLALLNEQPDFVGDPLFRLRHVRSPPESVPSR